MKKVYIVFEDYWHDIDGGIKTMVEIYSDVREAESAAQRFNDADGYQGEYFARTYVVEEHEVK